MRIFDELEIPRLAAPPAPPTSGIAIYGLTSDENVYGMAPDGSITVLSHDPEHHNMIALSHIYVMSRTV